MVCSPIISECLMMQSSNNTPCGRFATPWLSCVPTCLTTSRIQSHYSSLKLPSFFSPWCRLLSTNCENDGILFITSWLSKQSTHTWGKLIIFSSYIHLQNLKEGWKLDRKYARSDVIYGSETHHWAPLLTLPERWWHRHLRSQAYILLLVLYSAATSLAL